MGIKVFLDTSIYDNLNFSFDNRQLSKIKDMAIKDEIDLLYNEIVYQEVFQHISDNLSQAVNQYNQVLKEARALAPYKNNDTMCVKLCSLDTETMVAELRDKWDKFLKDCYAEKIDICSVDVDDIVDKYFKKILPFENKKPYEFKDAIIIDSIRQYARSYPDEAIYVVARDKGFRNSFRNDRNIIKCSDLNKAINQVVRLEENLVVELENKFDDTNFIFEVYSAVNNHLADASVSVEDVFDEVDIISAECDDIFFEYVDICDEDCASIVATANITFVVEYSERDEDQSYYDWEEERYYWEVYNRYRNTFSISTEFEVDVSINGDNTDFDDMVEYDDIIIDDDFYLKDEDLLDSEIVDTTSDEEPDDYTYDSSANVCPGCGCKITYANDAGAFCVDCAPDH